MRLNNESLIAYDRTRQRQRCVMISEDININIRSQFCAAENNLLIFYRRREKKTIFNRADIIFLRK